jgi:polyferredoxin
MLRRVLRPRVLIYTAVLVVICTLFAVSVAVRDPFRVDVVRDRSTLARIVDEGRIENVYRLQLMNATEHPQRYRVGVSGLAGAALADAAELELQASEARWLTVAVRVAPETAAAAGPGAHEIHFDLTRANALERLVSEKSTFVIPR